MRGMDTPETLAQAKARLRSRVRGRRRQRSEAERARLSAAAVEHLWAWLGPRIREVAAAGGTPTVATVLPMPTEPDTAGLRARAHACGARVLVPVTAEGRRMDWAQWHPGVATQRSAHAPVDEPVGERLPTSALQDAAALIMPGLAVDGTGMRLGQGGGYYDRAVGGLPKDLPRVALLFPDEVLPAGAVPAESTDRPVHGVATAEGLVWFGSGGRFAQGVPAVGDTER
jgi:5-formyltetrahydrofolate cyclo-ligase